MSTTKDNHVNLTANPGPLGLCGFALTTWLLCLINAGIFDTKSIGLVLGMAFALVAVHKLLPECLNSKKETRSDLPHSSVTVHSGGLGRCLPLSLKVKRQQLSWLAI